MDLRLSPEHEARREEFRTWLEANVPGELPPSSHPDGFRLHQEWERRLFEADYAAIAWPVEYGGLGADLQTQVIFAEEYERARAPMRVSSTGVDLAGRALLEHGTDEQRSQWLPKMLSCEEVWAQGFSEPESGSDLASLRTSAVVEGDHYLVNGQKVWSSFATHATWMFALVRTDREAPKHKGISMLMIDLRSPGVEVRPIQQIAGGAGFCEVFLTDVMVPTTNLVGQENNGWRLAREILVHERGARLGAHVRYSRILTDVIELANGVGVADDPRISDLLAQLYVETSVYRSMSYRTLGGILAGSEPGPDHFLHKLFYSEMMVRVYEAAFEVIDELAELKPDAALSVGGDRWQHDYWYARAAMIYGGTSEIQRNIISERLLGLPREQHVS